MFFKNVFAYQIQIAAAITAASLGDALSSKLLVSCAGLDKQNKGWVPCRGDDRMVYESAGHILFVMGAETKLLPASVINRFTKERVADIEAQQGYKVGRRELKDIKEAITEELLPRAFSTQRVTFAWIDTNDGRLIIDAPSIGRAEELIELLNKTIDGLEIKPIRTELSPVAAMTDWLAGDAAPADFTIDRDLELRATGESHATVRYAKHALDGEEILAHIAAGKRSTRLGMTWNDRISFVLTEQMQIKRIEFLDIIKEESTTLADTAEEMFELDFTLMAGELAKLITGLIDVLGGELEAK